MIILALETATRAGSTAVLEDGRLLGCSAGDPSRPHASRLPGDLLSLLDTQKLRLADVDLLAVCLGPGAFTGLRVGIAAMQGLAFANGRSILGVSALDALAMAAGRDGTPGGIGVWIDATRKEVFAARYERAATALGIEVSDPAVAAPPQTVLERWRMRGTTVERWIGDGALAYLDLIRQEAPDVDVMPGPLLAPLIGEAAWRLGGLAAAGPPHALRPMYVRRPDAEIARDRRESEARSAQ